MGQNGKRSNSLSEDEAMNNDDDDVVDHLQHPQQRNAANARERARMRVLSKAFCRLKTTLPWVPPDTKLSKLDTLRLATSYIAHLRTMLKLSENELPKHSVQPANMSWPFNFNVNWDTQTLNAEHTTAPKIEWKNYETKFDDKQRQSQNGYEKSCHYHDERRFSTYRGPNKVRRKTSPNDDTSDSIRDAIHDEYNYYKPYTYYET